MLFNFVLLVYPVHPRTQYYGVVSVTSEGLTLRQAEGSLWDKLRDKLRAHSGDKLRRADSIQAGTHPESL